VFLLLLVVGPQLGLGIWEYPFRFFALAAVLWVTSRNVVDLRCAAPALSVIVGIAVFGLWILPDLLWPGYRQSWLFTNSLTGAPETSIPSAELMSPMSPMVLLFRVLRAVVIVPIVEELFWRGWLMRWLIDHDFKRVPLGTYAPGAFWITAVLFASEHGPYWDVGLVAGIIYNWWMVRTRRLGDCIVAHAVTNAVLCGYVLWSGRWEYWL
jgi:CAAX prenyl protease-like protein